MDAGRRHQLERFARMTPAERWRLAARAIRMGQRLQAAARQAKPAAAHG